MAGRPWTNPRHNPELLGRSAPSEARRPAAHPHPALSSFADSNLLERLRKAATIAAVLQQAGIDRRQRSRILDLGAGSGVLGREVSRRLGARCTQVDVANYRLPSDLSFVQASGDALPFQSKTFDAVIANHVIEHVREQQGCLREIRRILKPGGVAYLSTPNKYALIEPHYRLPFLSWLPRGMADRVVRLFRRGNAYDVQPLSKADLYRVSTGAQFEVTDLTADIAKHPAKYHRPGLIAGLGGFAARGAGWLLLRFVPSHVLTLRTAETGRIVGGQAASGPGSRSWAGAAWERLREGAHGKHPRPEQAKESVRHSLGLARTFAMAFLGTVYLPLFLIASAPALYLGLHNTGAFNAPDETAAYMAAEEFAQTGHLYLQDELTRLNTDSPTAPRGFVQYRDRAIPIYSLGHLALVAIVRVIFGGAAPLALALVPGLLFVLLTLFMRVLYPAAPRYLGFGLLGVTPLWYWASRVYFDIGMTFLFITCGLICYALALRHGSHRWLFASSIAMGMAALTRQPEAPFLLILGLIGLLSFTQRWHKPLHRRDIGLVAGVYAAGQIISFILPALLLNWATNGSPFVFGYRVLYQFYWPDATQLSAANPILAALSLVKQVFFPQPMALGVVWNGLVNQVVLLVPYLLALGVAGYALGSHALRRHLGLAAIGLVVLGIVYVLVSRANPGTFLAQATEPDLRASVVRYWMPLYLALGFGLLYALARTPRAVSIALIAALAVTGTHQVWADGPESILNLQSIEATNSALYEQALTKYTETNALIYDGAPVDKWSAPVRRTVGLWTGTDIQISNQEMMYRVADAAAQVYRMGTPVYFLLSPANDLSSLSDRLSTYHLTVVHVAQIQTGVDLWRLAIATEDLQVSGTGNGVYATAAFSPGKNFAISIDQDGSAHNLLGNPSFETGLDGWSGPDVGQQARLSEEFSAFGRTSLRMELTGPETDFIRRSYSVSATDLLAGTWSVRVWVHAAQLENATAQLVVFVQDAANKNLERYSVSLDHAAEGFQPLTVQGPKPPASADHIVVQLALVPSMPGGKGVVYWDGVEVLPTSDPASLYCDGDHYGCAWEGKPNASPSRRTGGITGLTLRTDQGKEAVVPGGPFLTGDRLLVKDGSAVYLERQGSGPKFLGDVDLGNYDSLQLLMTDVSAPSVSLRAAQ